MYRGPSQGRQQNAVTRHWNQKERKGYQSSGANEFSYASNLFFCLCLDVLTDEMTLLCRREDVSKERCNDQEDGQVVEVQIAHKELVPVTGAVLAPDRSKDPVNPGVTSNRERGACQYQHRH